MAYACVFPGQGSQSVGMLTELHQQSAHVSACFSEASEVLGYDLWQIVQDGPADALGQTAVTQPAILTASVAIWRTFSESLGEDQQPTVMAGHSLGEYSALVCAGVLDFAAAVALVAERGRLMQEAVPEGQGAMSVVLGLDDDVIVNVCAEAAGSGVVEAVNFNSPGQVVIAGDTDAVARAGKAAKTAGARRVQPLPVSVPAHSSLMQPAAAQFAERLADVTFNEAKIKVLHNVGIDDVSDVRNALIQQLYSPVPWTQIVQTLSAGGVGLMLECGPGKVLCGLARRIDRALTAQPLQTPEDQAAALEAVTR